MNQTILTVHVEDQALQVMNAPVLASGGVNEIRIEFTFCGLWYGAEKTAVFYRQKNEPYYALLVDDAVTIPSEIMTEPGAVFFGVFGSADGITRSSMVVPLTVEQGAITVATSPSVNIYEQILAQYAGLLEAAKAAILDKTLTKAGQPADAGAAGERIRALENVHEQYGFGGTPATTTDMNTATNCGWYGWTWADAQRPSEDSEFGVVRVDALDANNLCQTAYDVVMGYIHRRFRIEGEWTIWEWVNPPLQDGRVYRTTERYQGKSVWITAGTILLDKVTLGGFTNVTWSPESNVPGDAEIISWEASFEGLPSDDAIHMYHHFPVFNEGELYMSLSLNNIRYTMFPEESDPYRFYIYGKNGETANGKIHYLIKYAY